MNKLSILNNIIKDLDDNGAYHEADELDNIYKKLITSQTISPITQIPKSTNTIPENPNPFLQFNPVNLGENNINILSWKKFLLTIFPETPIPLNKTFDNITQIKTEELAKNHNLQYTKGQIDNALLNSIYKIYPNDKNLNNIIKRLQETDPLKIDTNFGIYESKRSGIPIQTPSEKVYKIYRTIRDTYEGKQSTDPYDTGNKNPNNVPGGGGTKYGITQLNWDEYSKRNKLPLSPVSKISKKQADKVGFEDYKRSGAHILPPNTQLAVADLHFNSGQTAMIIVLRYVLNQPPIQIQNLDIDTLSTLIEQQKPKLIEMLKNKIKTQEDDEHFAGLINAARVKLLSGSKAKNKQQQFVYRRGLLKRIHDVAQKTGNESILAELYEMMEDKNPKEKTKLLQKYKIHRPTYYFLGYGDQPKDKAYRKKFIKVKK